MMMILPIGGNGVGILNTEIYYKSVGCLKYEDNYKLIMAVEQDIADYYRSLIPKWFSTNKPRWPAHVTVVRSEKEIPVNLDVWGKYQNEKCDFIYSPIINSGKIYFWLDVYCIKLEKIREELGLPARSKYTLPPEGYKKCFHCTIANMK